MSRVLLVAGTNGWNPEPHTPEWFEPGSPFVKYLRSLDIEPIFGDDGTSLRSFTWSTDLGGVGFGKGDLRVWQAAGRNLFDYLVPPLCPDRRVPPSDTHIICHSHGLQVVLFALAYGLKADSVISIGSPIRKDMEPTTLIARSNVRRWLHVHSDASDYWQILGSLFDGRVGMVREAALADQNDFVASVGHSELLNKAEHFHYWNERGWLGLIR